MYTETFESDAKVWIAVLKNSLHSGNAVGSARLHMVQQMVNKRLEWLGSWHGESDRKHQAVMETVARLCEFGKEREVTANEKNIYMHTMIDLLKTELKNLPTMGEEPGYIAPHVPIGDVYPLEDGPEYISPLPPLGDIPF